jgi:hypothetical protein
MVKLVDLEDIQDTNYLQSFKVQDPLPVNDEFRQCAEGFSGYLRFSRYMRITFPSSTDFYGRITIYNLNIYGYSDDLNDLMLQHT